MPPRAILNLPCLVDWAQRCAAPSIRVALIITEDGSLRSTVPSFLCLCLWCFTGAIGTWPCHKALPSGDRLPADAAAPHHHWDRCLRPSARQRYTRLPLSIHLLCRLLPQKEKTKA